MQMKKTQDIATKTPEEHLEIASTNTKEALAALKDRLSLNNMTDLAKQAELQKQSMIAAAEAMNSLVKAGQSGAVQMAGGYMAYDPTNGFYWQEVVNGQLP